MSDKTGIEWTDATWNPFAGCSIVSPGCTQCYAMTMAARIERMGTAPHYAGLTEPSKAGPVWSGKLALASTKQLTQPLRWTRARKIFVNSMSDLFHEDAPDDWIDQVFAIMALCPQHIFQILTKRPERMRAYVSDPKVVRRIYELACDIATGLGLKVVLIAPGVDEALAPPGPRIYLDRWPLPNVWLGVSTERQTEENEKRIALLLNTPAAVRFISAEPLLGPLDVLPYLFIYTHDDNEVLAEPQQSHAVPELPFRDPLTTDPADIAIPRIDWVIVGGESGPKARPMHPDWVRSLRDQCTTAGVPFFFKQWGEWLDADSWYEQRSRDGIQFRMDGKPWQPPQPLNYEAAKYIAGGWAHEHQSDGTTLIKVGKRRAGRLLDGVAHSAFPAQMDESHAAP